MGDFFSASRCCCASGPAAMPIGIWSGGFERNAKPRASARSSGKPKTQKTASVSRRNSFVRTMASSTSAGRGLYIAQLPSGQREEQREAEDPEDGLRLTQELLRETEAVF